MYVHVPQDDEGRQNALFIYAVFIGPFVLIASLFFTWVELRYLVSGVTTDAQVVRITTVDDPRRGTIAGYKVEYRFTDNGVDRAEEETVGSLDGQPFKSNRSLVTVDYVPGIEDRSRLAGQRRWWVAIPLVLSVAGVSAVVIKALLIYRKEQQYDASRKRRGLI